MSGLAASAIQKRLAGARPNGIGAAARSDRLRKAKKSRSVYNVGFTCKRGWRGPGPARAVIDAIDRWKLLLDTRPTLFHECREKRT